MSTKRTKGWHFLQADKRLRWGTKEVVEAGRTSSCEGPIVLCENGLHASKLLLDALAYAPGPVACRVEVWGDVVTGYDKLAGRHRKVLWMLDATAILHEFACRCAEDALALIQNPDARSVAAIAAKRKWMRGEITNEELAAASAAAYAARDAAWAASYADWAASAAARDAASAAAYAASAAARDAASYAAKAAQNRRLTALVCAAHRKGGKRCRS